MLKGDSPGDSPAPNWDPALCAKVTTGGLSALSPDGKQGATPYGLMDPGPLSMFHFLASTLRSLVVAITAEKQKVIFLLDGGAISLSYHSLLVPGPMTRLSFWAYLVSP
jgi:hypothetical protein